MDFSEFLYGLWQNIELLAIPVLLFLSYRYLRALFKRFSLLLRLRRIARKKGYTLRRGRGFYLSVFFSQTAPELTVKAKGKTFSIKMFACLKRKHTYILTGINSYYTKSNFHPIIASRHNMRHHFFFPSPRQLQIKNDYITEIKEGKEPQEKPTDSAVKILCLSPVPVSIEAVHTNRPEPLFDGDLFHGYMVFSGNALCEFLKNGCLPPQHDKQT